MHDRFGTYYCSVVDVYGFVISIWTLCVEFSDLSGWVELPKLQIYNIFAMISGKLPEGRFKDFLAMTHFYQYLLSYPPSRHKRGYYHKYI